MNSSAPSHLSHGAPKISYWHEDALHNNLRVSGSGAESTFVIFVDNVMAPWKGKFSDRPGESYSARYAFLSSSQHFLRSILCFYCSGASVLTIYLVLDPEFLELLGPDPELEFIANADAHEGGVYYPDREEFYFSTSKVLEPKPNAQLMKLSLITKEISTVLSETAVANGMVLDRNGELLVCEQGVGAEPGYIQKVNLRTLETSIVTDNWAGLPLNSPNDVVVKSDGSIWFTDPDYAWVQGFKHPPRISPQVYRISPSGVVDLVADGFVKPNGLAFSHDEKLLYVTDTGSTVGDGTVIESHPHSVIVFDVGEDAKTLCNRRLFASMSTLDGSNNGIGVPDGIKVDKQGRVYVANLDGVQVFNGGGKLLGLIRMRGASNLGFVGKKGDKLMILNGDSIQAVQLRVQGAGLHYVESFV